METLNRIRCGLLAALLSATLLPGTATAAVATNNLNISVSVPATANLTVQAMDFGSSFNTATDLQATATLTVRIDQSIPYNVTLDAGLNFSGERRMSNGSGGFRSYLLYKDAARTQLWGDSDFAASYTSGSSTAATATANQNAVITVYGLSPGGTHPAGNYSDAVTVTIHY
ncbi:MAG: spore coat protein U domain-containing protein [Nitrosomonadales bacterium]|nr:spore coat protein U domain-containing protein [Nitrosomonadales bacterium]